MKMVSTEPHDGSKCAAIREGDSMKIWGCLILMSAAFGLSIVSAADEPRIRPLYSLTNETGHESFSCTGTLKYTSNDFKGEQRRDVAVDCKRIKKRPRVQRDFYMSRERTRAFNQAKKTGTGWNAEYKSLKMSINEAQTEITFDGKHPDVLKLKAEGPFSVVSGFKVKSAMAEVEGDNTYFKQGEILYPKTIVAQTTVFIGASETTDNLAMDFAACTSK